MQSARWLRVCLGLGAAFALACGDGNNNGDEVCNNGADDDGDGAADCLDADCNEDAACQPPGSVGGFSGPESVFFDAGSNAWYVANSDNGTISQLDAGGNVVALDFASGLLSPHGMRSAGGSLFVADDPFVREIDIATGEIVNSIDVSGALQLGNSFLNDLEVDAATGDIFVSDFNGNLIVRLVGGVTPEIFVEDNAFNSPNGLRLQNGSLLVGNFNGNGELLSVNLADKSVTEVTQQLGKIDGIELDGENLLTSNFGGNGGAEVISTDVAGVSTVLLDGDALGFDVAADIGFDAARRIVAVPDLGQNVFFFDLDN